MEAGIAIGLIVLAVGWCAGHFLQMKHTPLSKIDREISEIEWRRTKERLLSEMPQG